MGSLLHLNSTLSKALALVFATSMLVMAQDDPYGVGTPASPADTLRPAPVQTDPASTPVAAETPVDTTPAPKAPRTRITRETTVNPMDVHRGSYRNPKKALFMSLIVPGLGQAYIGQTKFNYIRAAGYFTAEVTMGLLWYQFSVVKYDRKVKQYRTFADLHWSQAGYEQKITDVSDIATQASFELLNPGRVSYCASVQRNISTTEQRLYRGCVEPYDRDPNHTTQQDYNSFKATLAGDVPGPNTGARRNAFPDDVAFYEMIGANQEFLFGWDDVVADPAFAAGASNPGYEILGDTSASWIGVSANRDSYNSMRQSAKDYSRMQAWFFGGIVLNHIASAVDAAITARRHNRILYEDGEARWFDKINLDGGMAFDQGRPRTHMIAYLSF